MEVSYYKSMEPFWGSWKIKRLIGEGSFGKVFEIERENFGKVYRAAMKTITIPQSESELKSVLADGMDMQSATSYYKSFVEEVVDEFALMAELKGNSNIVSYEDHMVIEHEDGIGWDILIRMELLTPLLDLNSTERPMGRSDVIKLGIDICKALEYCQKRNIIHRDIKPENIFISNSGDYKLGDFGIARTVEKTSSGLSRKGTYTYMAPEVYRGEKYGARVDIYSLGIVLYRLLNNNRAPFLPPFPEPITHSDREESIAKRIGGQPIPMPEKAQDKLGEIILKACAYAPEDRYALPEQMRAELEAVLTSSDADFRLTAESVKEMERMKDEEDTGDDRTELMYGAQDDDRTVTENTAKAAGTSEPDATVSIFSDTDTGGQETEPVESRQASHVQEKPVFEETVRTKPEEPKKKNSKKGLFIGIGAAAAAVVAVICIILGNRGSDAVSYEADSDTENSYDFTFDKDDDAAKAEEEAGDEEDISESEPAADEKEPDGGGKMAMSNALLYGEYVIEEGRVSSPDDPFMDGMELVSSKDGIRSALPFRMCLSPEGSMYKTGISQDRYLGNSELGRSREDVFNYIAVSICGDEISDRTQAFYEENIRDKMDSAFLQFVEVVDGRVITVGINGYYRVKDSVMEFGYPQVDESGQLYMETMEFDINFSGRNLELSGEGVTRTLMPYDFVSEEGTDGISGYASSDEDACMGISHIVVEDMSSENASACVEFTDGRSAVDPVVEVGGENTVTISWEEVMKPEIPGIQEETVDSAAAEITFQYLSCGEVGFVLQSEGQSCLYQKSKSEYYVDRLQDSLDDPTLYYDDFRELPVEFLQALAARQNMFREMLLEILDESMAGILDDVADIDGNACKITVSGSTLFATDDAELTGEGMDYLDIILTAYEAIVGSNGTFTDTDGLDDLEFSSDLISDVWVEVHTDSAGDYDENQYLTEERAEAIEDYCYDCFPELYDFIYADGYSSDFPIYDENGNEDSEASDRIVFKIVLNTEQDKF